MRKLGVMTVVVLCAGQAGAQETNWDEVRFEVQKGTPMKSDMTATLGSFGITGLKYIEITGGSYDSPDVAPGGEIQSRLSILGRITDRADSIASKVDRLLGKPPRIRELRTALAELTGRRATDRLG